MTNAADHGPTCADTPVDHRCGDTEQDQCTTWQESLSMMSERNRLVASLHRKTEGPGGMTDGLCAECGHTWPCQTFHIAAGWGYGDTECYESGWCSHAEMHVEVLYGETP